MSSRIDLLIFEDAQEQKERRKKESKNRKKRLAKIEKIGYCEGFLGKCDNRENLEWIPTRTFYQWDIDEEPLEDPNRSIYLCSTCAEEHSYIWDEKWNEYYAGLL